MTEKNKVNIIISATSKGVKEAATQAQAGIKNAFTKGKEAVAAFTKETGKSQKSVSALGGAVKTLLTGVIGFQAIRKATQIMQDADNAAFSMQTSVAAANREFDKVGSVQEWEQTVKDLSKELRIYSDTALKGAVSRTVDMTKRLGLSAEQMKVVIKRSADLGAGKVDLEGAIERVTAALRGEAESAEYLGLTLNENYVKGVYEADKANVKAWKDLTDLEKAQARYNVFLKQTEQVQGRAAASAETFSGAIAMIKKEIDNTLSNSKDLEDAMANVAEVIKQNAGEIGRMVSVLVTAAAKVVELAVEYKELLLTLAGTAIAASVVSKLVVVIKGLNAAFSALFGLGIISSLKSIWIGFQKVGEAIYGVTRGMSLLGKAFVALGVLMAIKDLYDIATAFIAWRKAASEAKKAQESLIDNTDKVMRKFKEFRNFKLPSDITKATQQELDEFRKKLASARAYYVALKMKMEEKGETEGLADIDARLKEIQIDFARVSEAAGSAATEMQKPADAVKATDDQLKAFAEQAKKAYEEAKKQAADYAQKVIEYEDKIKYARLSTEDKIRELGRKGLEDAVVWADKKREAEEKLYAARAAMASGDFALAEKLAKDAESLYADLATEVKGSKDGADVVVKSIEDTKEVAINGVKTVGQFVDELYTAQKNAAQTAQTEWTATADGIKAQLEEIAKQREANVVIQLKQLEAAQNAINNLIKPEYKDIYVRVHQQQAKAQGGIAEAYKHGGIAGAFNTTASVIRAATGKILPGFGGGDRIRAILEAGEGVLRKEAIAGLGKKFFFAYNSLNIPVMIKELLGKKISGFSIPQINMPSMSRLAFADGGIAPRMSAGPGETFILRLQAGDVEMPLNVMGNKQAMRGMIKEFEKELIKLGMVKR